MRGMQCDKLSRLVRECVVECFSSLRLGTRYNTMLSAMIQTVLIPVNC